MTTPGPGTNAARTTRVVLAVALAALAYKVYLALATRGSNDIWAFWYFLQEYRGSGAFLLYERESEFNHPPFLLRWLVLLRECVQASGLEPWFWVRLPAILADLGTLLLVVRLVSGRLAGPGRPGTGVALVLVAGAPVSVMVSGFHGNNDPVMMFLVVLSVFLLERGSPVWLAGLAMGMAVNFKAVPLVFWPAIFLWLPSMRRRAEYFGGAVAAVLVASHPILYEAPALVFRKVLGYKPDFGFWGVSWFLEASPSLESVSALLASWDRALLAAALVAASLWMNLGRRKPGPFVQVGVIAFLFLALTQRFGVQYLAWLVPFLVLLPLRAAVAVTATHAVFLFFVYTFWCQGVVWELSDPDWLKASFWSQGLPWDFADANSMGPWRGPLVPFQIAAWAGVVWGAVALLRRAAAERAAVSEGSRP